MRKKVRQLGSNYAVGYGHPPTSTRFQPGQSGNPKGRPKGARNASSLAREALERKVDVNVNGRTQRKVTVREAAYLRLAEKAVGGDVRALQCLLSLESQEHAPGSDEFGRERSAAEDLAILQKFFDRRRAIVLEDEQLHPRPQHTGQNPERKTNE
jgi:hypothetical protein